MKAPKRISGIRVAETTKTPTTPIASAPPRPATDIAIRVRSERWVPSGRPFSSSRQWAAIPTARKKAATAAATRTG